MKISALVPTLTLGAALVLPATEAQAFSTTWQECTVIEVATFANRVHIKCAGGNVFGPYFASPTSNSAEATRLVTLGTAALIGGGKLQILLPLDDFSGQTYGCAVGDCRRPIEIFLTR